MCSTRCKPKVGGNATIVNTTDINAQEGHPSQGLMQVIPSTFAAYHVAGTSNSITDPLANIAAALELCESHLRADVDERVRHGHRVG